MKIPMYITGIIKRLGPQHGYEIKKNISGQVSDFTQIKLPVIYYHLDKMKDKGLLLSKKAKDARKPEKTIYSLTPKGEKEFRIYLEKVCNFRYKPDFLNDALFFFADSLEENQLFSVLEEYAENLKAELKHLQRHRADVEQELSGRELIMSTHIFNHHFYHYKAELEWVTEVLKQLNVN